MKYLKDVEGIKKFGLKVREIRLAKNYTQESLAWEANIEPMQVSRIERGIINTNISQILNLAKALGVPASELLNF